MNEFHYDGEYLRFIPNTTDVGDVVVPILSNLFDFTGTSSSNPIRNVTIQNLIFTETRPTFMDPRTYARILITRWTRLTLRNFFRYKSKWW